MRYARAPANALPGVHDTGLQAYGWLSLNRRGTWLIRGAPVTHPAVRDYLAAHFRADAHGCWHVRNGPQLAYVALETAPLIVWLEADGHWHSHLGRPTGAPTAALLDEHGGLWLDTPAGPAWADEGAFERIAAALVDAGGDAATAEQIEALGAGRGAPVWLECGGARVPVAACPRAQVPGRLRFVPVPRPAA